MAVSGSAGTKSRNTRFKWDVMSSLFNRPSDIRRAQQMAITSLVTLGTAVLFGLVSALNSWQQRFIRAVTTALWLCSTLLVQWWNGCSSKSLISRRSQRLKSGLSRRFESIKCLRFIEVQKVACIESMPRGGRFTSRHLSSQSKASHVERNGVIPKRHNYY